ncbi:hypothetical protein [Streptococcus sanguinis]|uniref:hypothetical protein n=1 Tax=Streptococcus sanguinis TaxID=1305 RepID=UPI000F26DE00|nr:hypothetical protein [Streptococcus sanguinis]MBZ2056979.1 hypothetical protein [Streptococcus sanguinis]RKV90877.1 MAG: hypothetical protein D8H99_32690 [Streptococcus sp.]
MSKNSIRFALQKGQLSFNEENSFAKDFLDIDFFNSRKSRILDNIKAENELQKLNETCIHEFKRAMSN